jgi:hypothetical protein
VPNIGPIELILMVLSPVLLIVIGVVPAGEACASPGPVGWPNPARTPEIAPTLSDLLRELEEAKNAGLVTEEEYIARRNRLLGVQ